MGSKEVPEAILRTALPDEAAALTALCLRSKAHWGYDDAFMAACRDELTVHEADIAGSFVQVATVNGEIAAVAEIGEQDQNWYLDKLFVDPPFMGFGLGRTLLNWAAHTAAQHGATSLEIGADPDAAAFYQHCGAIDDGEMPSDSIPGRFLPRMVLSL